MAGCAGSISGNVSGMQLSGGAGGWSLSLNVTGLKPGLYTVQTYWGFSNGPLAAAAPYDSHNCTFSIDDSGTISGIGVDGIPSYAAGPDAPGGGSVRATITNNADPSLQVGGAGACDTTTVGDISVDLSDLFDLDDDDDDDDDDTSEDNDADDEDSGDDVDEEEFF